MSGFLTLSQVSYSQLIDDWILAYSHPVEGDVDFDMSKKRMNLRGILVFEEDSLFTIGFEEADLEIKKIAYKYMPDSLYIRNKYVEQLILDKDTIRNIDTKYKGSYNVLYRLASPKHDYEMDFVREFLMRGNFVIDFSKVLVMQNREFQPLVDTLTFGANNELISKGHNTESWRLLKVKKNIFLEIDDMLYVQVYRIKKNMIVFKSYFDVEHEFVITRVK
jgi:hypothetical protein